MSLELIREAIKVSQPIGEQTAQAIVENDIIVPDSKPDISRVLLLDGDAYISSSDVMQDKLHVSGTIGYKILYLSDDAEQGVKSINTSVPFSETLEIPNVRHGMSAKVRGSIEHIDYEILNGRKVGLKTILNLNGKVSDVVDQEIVNDLSGIDNIQTLRGSISINCFLGCNEDSLVVRENLELPAGKPTLKEVLRTDVKLTGKDYKVTDNKVIAKGDLNIQTLYLADDEEQSIQLVEHEVPFTQFIDVVGVHEAARCEVDFQLSDSAFDLGEDSDGELRFINAEIPLKIYVSAYDEKSLATLEDAYSPRAKLDLETKPFHMAVLSHEENAQISVRDTLIVPEESPEIAEVFNVISKPSLTDCKIVDDKIVIEGVVNNSVLYLSNNEDQPVYCFSQEIPFRQSIDARGIQSQARCEAELDVDHCNYSMIAANEVEVRLSLTAGIKVLDEAEIQTISRVIESPLDDKRAVSQPSITIYFAQTGDTLWKIAKKYYTTVEDLRKANSLIASDVVEAGQQIFIMRKIS